MLANPKKSSDPFATLTVNPIVRTHINILEQIASTLDFEEVLKRIVEAAVQFSGADEGSLLLLDEETNELYMRASKGFGQDYASTFRQPVSDDNIAGRVMKTGRPVLIGPESGLGEQVKVKTGYFARSILNLPIKQHDITHGVLAVYNSGSHRTFTQHHLLLLTPLANYAAVAIKNARRYEETRQLLGDAYTLFDMAGLFTETRNLDELLERIASVSMRQLEAADRVAIHLLDPDTKRLERKVRIPSAKNEPVETQGFGIGEGIAGRVLQEDRPINIPNVKDDPSFEARGITSGSLFVAPISRHNTCIGTISTASPQENAFRRRDERFLTSLANLAAFAIENARLYAQQLKLNEESQERLEIVERRNRELSSLRDILGALQSTLSLPEVLARIANGVVKGLNYRAVMLATIDEARQLLTVREFAVESDPALRGVLKHEKLLVDKNSQKLIGKSVSLLDHTDNLGIQVCQDGRARVTHSLDEIARPVAGQEMCRLLQDMFLLTTFAVLPIKSEHRLLGVLYAATQQEEISQADLEALQAFANQAALAIQNARQFEHVHGRLRRRVRELQSLQNIDRLIMSTPNLEMVLRNILDVGLKLVYAEYGAIVLSGKETGELVLQVSYPEGIFSEVNYERSLAGQAARARQTKRAPDLSATPWADAYRDINIRSELAAPILKGKELMGVISMGSSRPDVFTEEDESLLDILATQAAVAIQTARYNQELEETRLRSLEAERIAAMSDIATNMVHSINNTDGAIRVLVQQIRLKLSQGALSDEFLAKRLDDIQASAEKTLEMARNIRNPFRDQPTEPIDVNACLMTVLENIKPFPPTIELALDLDYSLPLVKGTQQLGEVFRNLVNNAVEAMQNEGTLQIASKQVGPAVEVAVADSGPGIAHHLTEADIFKLGVTGKEGGLGYGLWWCRIYLNRIGGSIRFDSNVTTGCKFIVKLSPAETGQPESER